MRVNTNILQTEETSGTAERRKEFWPAVSANPMLIPPGGRSHGPV